MYYSFLACQSIGAAGLAAGTKAVIFGATTGIGGLAAGLFGKKKKKNDAKDEEESDSNREYKGRGGGRGGGRGRRGDSSGYRGRGGKEFRTFRIIVC